MQQIPATPDALGRVAPLLADDRPIPIRLWAVLDGIIPGRLVVDDPDQPRVALVQERAEGTTYLARESSATQLAAGIALLGAAQPVVVCLWPGDPRRALLPPAPSYEGQAIDFLDRDPAVNLDSLATLPAGYALRPIDAALAPALAGFDYYAAMFGSREAALAQTVGAAILHGEQGLPHA